MGKYMEDNETVQVILSEKVKEYLLNSMLFRDSIESIITSLYLLSGDADQELSDALKDIIINLDEKIGEKDLRALLKDYKAVIRYIDQRYRNNSNMGRTVVKDINNYATLSIRQEVVDLCMRLLGCKENSCVFLPYARDSKFALSLHNCDIEGFEPDAINWGLSSILLDSYGIPANIFKDIKQLDEKKQYDYIISCPPAVIGNNSNIVQSFIGWLDNSLKAGGEMCLLLPQNFTSSNKWSPFRKYIVDHKDEYNMVVISLPSDSFIECCEINMCIVIIIKTNKPGENYVFMDANKPEFVTFAEYSNPMKVNAIFDVLTDPESDLRYIKAVAKNELTGNNDFTPKRYFAFDHILPPRRYLKKGEQLIAISELISVPIGNNNISKTPTGKVVGLRELSDKFLNAEIDVDALPEREVRGLKAVEPQGLFAGYLNGKIKIGRISKECSVEKIYLRHEVVQLFVKPNGIISEDFLMMSLLSDDLAKQANMMAFGTIFRRLSRNDFMLMKIIVPTKEEQDKRVRMKSDEDLLDVNATVHEKFDEYRRDMHVKKHAIGQTIFNLNNWFSLLKIARQLGNGIVDDNAEIGKNRKTKVSAIYDNIETVLSTLTHQLNMFDVGYGMQSSPIDLVDFIRNYIETHRNPMFEYDFDPSIYGIDRALSDLESEEVGESVGYYVNFPKEALTTILDNIVTNACVHGFTEKDRNYKIRIEIYVLGTDVELFIMNNGKPLQEGISVEDVFTYSISTGGKEHFGIGGYEIRKLMREFDGEADLELGTHSDYTLCYRLTFHNTMVDKDN